MSEPKQSTTRYFDPNANPQDALLLPKSIRDHEELDVVAQMAELAVINRYSVSLRPEDAVLYGIGGIYQGPFAGAYKTSATIIVALKGYHPDPTQADGYNADGSITFASLLQALKLAIADTTVWQLAQRKREVGVSNETGTSTQKGRTFREDAEGTFSPRFEQFLRLYSLRPVAWAL